MKKIYVLMIALISGFGVFAQTSIHQTIDLAAPVTIHPMPYNANGVGGGSHLWLEYDSANSIIDGAQVHTIQWLANKRYTPGFSHPANYYTFQDYIIRFDTLFDLYTGQSVDRDTVTSITIDSIYAELGHKNSSHTNDTLIVRITDLNNRLPGDGTNVLWSDTIITNTSLSPLGDWKSPVRAVWTPNYTNLMQGFAVEFDYYGSYSDTCAFVSGFTDLGASTGLCPHRAALSNYYPNSFATWTDFMSSYPIIPDPSSGFDLIQDCNQNGQFDDGVDGYNFLADIVMGAYITINHPTGLQNLNKTGFTLSQNYPNPVTTTTDIKYELANNTKDVVLSVYDIVGSKVMEIKEGSKVPGKYAIHFDATKLARGMYTYTLHVDGSQLTRKMIVE